MNDEIIYDLRNEVESLTIERDDWRAVAELNAREANDPNRRIAELQKEQDTTRGELIEAREELKDATDALLEMENKIAQLEKEVLTQRPVADAYRRICHDLGIEKDILGYIKFLTKLIRGRTVTEIRKIKGFTQSGTDEQRKFYQMGISDAAEAVEQLSLTEKT